MSKYKKHPDLDEVLGKLELKILNNFVIDWSLPKYDKQFTPRSNEDPQQAVLARQDFVELTKAGEATFQTAQSRLRTESRSAESRMEQHVLHREADRPIPWYKNIWPFRKYERVEKTFDHIKYISETLPTEDVAKPITELNAMIERYRKLGQTNMVDLLLGYGQVIILESILAKHNKFNTYIKEEQFVEFMKRANRGISIDYIKYYLGFVPDEVAALKAEADELKIFDNYCVAHFDANRTSVQLSPKQRILSRDPILFGMIAGSRKLYFIGDWVTPEDDLTFDKIMSVIENPNLREQRIKVSTMNDIVRNLQLSLDSLEPVSSIVTNSIPRR